MSELRAPSDSSFVYTAADPPWRWRTCASYGFDIDPERYPTLAHAATVGHETEGYDLTTLVPYGMLTVSTTGARLIGVARGYAWDGSTGGTEGEAGRRASCLHDALYQIMRRYELDDWDTSFRSGYRADADRLFYDVQKADGMPWWRRTVRWLAVRTWPGNIRRQGMAVYDDGGEALNG